MIGNTQTKLADIVKETDNWEEASQVFAKTAMVTFGNPSIDDPGMPEVFEGTIEGTLGLFAKSGNIIVGLMKKYSLNPRTGAKTQPLATFSQN